MAEVIGVRFKNVGKVYYFDPAGVASQKGDMVIVETARGVECGEVAMENRDVPDERIVHPLKKMIRKASEADLKKGARQRPQGKERLRRLRQKIAEHKLDMKLVDVEYTFDNNKILFYFHGRRPRRFPRAGQGPRLGLPHSHRAAADRRAGRGQDARRAGHLRQALLLLHLSGEFQPVSIKMAKEQGLSLNPVKISGTCGRLMCCLKYEQVAYSELLRTTPPLGAVVNTPEGRGVVVDQNLLTGALKVRMDRAPEAAPLDFNVKQVRVVKDSQIKVAKEELEKLKSLEE